jgi:hypothetical protein
MFSLGFKSQIQDSRELQREKKALRAGAFVGALHFVQVN